jgi:tRNA(fMet)-specific endonuclease VapC
VSGAASYLLDTNILSDLVRNPSDAVAGQIVRVGEASVCTSIVVAAELSYGGLKSGSEKLAERVDLILSAMGILRLDIPSDREYAALRHTLTRQETPIGPNDLLIAAHAMAHNLTVVTGNVREFLRVPGLKVENWLEPPDTAPR